MITSHPKCIRQSTLNSMSKRNISFKQLWENTPDIGDLDWESMEIHTLNDRSMKNHKFLDQTFNEDGDNLLFGKYTELRQLEVHWDYYYCDHRDYFPFISLYSIHTNEWTDGSSEYIYPIVVSLSPTKNEN